MIEPIGFLGIVVLLMLAWAMSESRRRFPWRVVVGGVGLQFLLGVVLLKFDPAVATFNWIAGLINQVISSTDEGIEFVWGEPLAGFSQGFIFAIHAMSVVIFFASLMAVLFHIGLMQRLIAVLAWMLRAALGVTGTEALAMAANVFVGQTEAPLCVKPYIERMTRSQIMTLMVGGFATIAGSVLAAYVGMLGGEDEASRELFIRHLLTASVMSAPAAFVMAKVIVPETEAPFDEGLQQASEPSKHVNALDAAASGASDGMRLALNIVAMLIAFVAMVALINQPLGWLGSLFDQDLADGSGWQTLSLQTIFGTVFMPLAWVMGVEWVDCSLFGTLLGEKLVVTEFIAYQHLSEIANPVAEDSESMSPRSIAIAAYALCGFANVASIAIQIGGLSVLAPSKRKQFVTLGPKAMIGGALASWMTATIAGLFL